LSVVEECRADTRRIDKDDSLIEEFRGDFEFHALDADLVTRIFRLGDMLFENSWDLGFGGDQ
jgi:hypothetical protein